MLKDDKILYWISRNNKLSNVLLILITNKGYFYEKIRDDVKSSFDFEFMFFDNYNTPEVENILKKRCNNGFDKYDPSVLKIVSAMNVSAFNSDVRVGLKALRRIFKDVSSLPISEENIRNIMEEESINITNDVLQGLNARNGLLLNLIYKYQYSHKVYSEYCKRASYVVRSQFAKYLDELERLNLIKISKVRIGKTNTQELRLNLESKNIKILTKLFQRTSDFYEIEE